MKSFSALAPVAFCAGLLILATACSPLAESEQDEIKNSYYLQGQSRKNSMDYKGALESFEKALEANPRSASAHLEMGLLHEKMGQYARAIYHFEKHLELRPESNVADSLKPRIDSCMIELAKKVSFSLVNNKVQAALDRLTTENNALRQQVEELRGQLGHASAPNNRSSASTPPSMASSQAQPESQRTPLTPPPATPMRTEPLSQQSLSRATLFNSSAGSSSLRPHRVQSGETFYSIARRYGISPQKLQAANPGVNARRLAAGSTIYVPAN